MHNRYAKLTGKLKIKILASSCNDGLSMKIFIIACKSYAASYIIFNLKNNDIHIQIENIILMHILCQEFLINSCLCTFMLFFYNYVQLYTTIKLFVY